MYIQFCSRDSFFSALPVTAKTTLTTTSRSTGTVFEARVKSCRKLETRTGAHAEQLEAPASRAELEGYAKSPTTCSSFHDKVRPESRHSGGSGQAGRRPQGQLCGSSACVRLHSTKGSCPHCPQGASTVSSGKGAGEDRDHLIQPQVIKDEITTEAQRGKRLPQGHSHVTSPHMRPEDGALRALS